MPDPDKPIQASMPTLEEIAQRNGFSFPGNLKMRFAAIDKPVQKDVPPAPKPRDPPPQPRLPEPRPVRVDAMIDHTASVEQMMRTVSRADILEGRININDTVAQICAMQDADAQAKAFKTMEALCDFNLVEQMRVVARRKSREGLFTSSKALTLLAKEIEDQAEHALKEAQK